MIPDTPGVAINGLLASGLLELPLSFNSLEHVFVLESGLLASLASDDWLNGFFLWLLILSLDNEEEVPGLLVSILLLESKEVSGW